jgi:flagellar export protein FliJ
MARNTLHALIRLRGLMLDQAGRELAQVLQTEAEAEAKLAAAHATVAREMETATNVAGGDVAVEAFARWLKQASIDCRRASDAQQRASAEAARARANVWAAQAALEAAQGLKATYERHQKEETERQLQKSIDERAAGLLARELFSVENVRTCAELFPDEAVD